MGMREQIAKALLGKQAAPLAGKPGGVWEGGIRAYHSSPHDFDRVDFSKLRTGEGANVYGAGHYMAENPAVSGQGGQYWKQFSDRFPLDEASAAAALFDTGFDRTKAIEHARRLVGEAKPDTPIARQRLNALRLLEEGGPVGPRTYEMNLRAKPEELLDWDKPLREQPQVLDALSGSRRKSVQETLKAHDYEAPTRVTYGTDIGPVTGQDFYKALSLNLEGKPVGVKASDALRAGGIPGIRYLDEGSRPPPQYMLDRAKQTLAGAEAHGDPAWIAKNKAEVARLEELMTKPATYNYVGTDPSRLDILAKYGLAGAAAIPPTLGAFTRQDTYEARP